MAYILIVDDERNIRRSLRVAIEDWGHKVDDTGTPKEAVEKIQENDIDVVITDLIMGDVDGIELLNKIKQISPTTEVILMSAHGTISRAVEAIRLGAMDFVEKPFSIDRLEMVLERTLANMELKKTVRLLQKVLSDTYPFEDIVAASPLMKNVMHQVAMVSKWDVPVLIRGESGVGKELVALAVHHLSERSGRPFVPVNCGAFPDTLLDSELFGHAKGAFTGASVNKRGLIEEANTGTLFLDEIGEAPAAFQVRLLRFLDNGFFRRVGEVTERNSNARIIAATNRNIEDLIKEKLFREDLYFRLSVAVIEIPPLRERREDIPVLCKRFLESYGKKMDKQGVTIHPYVYALFAEYGWPGNVRELENTIEHSMIVARQSKITIEDLPQKLVRLVKQNSGININGDLELKEVERRYIISILEKTGGNKKKAADILNISRTTLISRLKSYGIT